MIRRSDFTVVRAGGPAAPGVYITVKTDTGDLADLFHDDGTALANPLRSDSNGVFVYNVADPGTYVEEYRRTLKGVPPITEAIYLGQISEADIYAAVLAAQNEIADDTEQMAGYVGDVSQQVAAATAIISAIGAAPTSGLSFSAANRTAMALLATDRAVVLMEAGREGTFVFDSSNLSAKVTADTAQGIYVPPSSDTTGASGAWVRKFTDPADVRWFGAVGDDTTNDGPPFLAAIAYLNATATTLNTTNKGSAELYARGKFYLGTSTLDLFHSLTFGGAGIKSATQLRWADGTTGIRVQRYNTEGATAVSSPTHFGADGCLIQNMTLVGGYASTESESHGVHLRAAATLRNLEIYNFPGDGIHGFAVAGGGAGSEGNANNVLIDNCFAQSCRTGLFIDGPDANVWLVQHFNGIHNRQWCIWDSSFLLNTFVSPHAAANGWDGALGSIATASSFSGNRYAVKLGQAAGASTNAPSGTTADNTWWLYEGAGGAYNGCPLWVSGTPFREGGSYRIDDANDRSLWLNAYAESDQNEAQSTGISLFFLGLGGVSGGATLNITGGGLSSNLQLFAPNIVCNSSTVASQFDTINIKGSSSGSALVFYDRTLGGSGAGAVTLYNTGGRAYFYQAGNVAAFDSTGMDLQSGKVLKNNGQQVLGARGAAIPALTVTATTGTLPTASGSVTIANAASPTNAELLDLCMELAAKQETLLSRLRAATGHGVIA